MSAGRESRALYTMAQAALGAAQARCSYKSQARGLQSLQRASTAEHTPCRQHTKACARLEQHRVATKQLQRLHSLQVERNDRVVVVDRIVHDQAVGRLLLLQDCQLRVLLRPRLTTRGRPASAQGASESALGFIRRSAPSSCPLKENTNCAWLCLGQQRGTHSAFPKQAEATAKCGAPTRALDQYQAARYARSKQASLQMQCKRTLPWAQRALGLPCAQSDTPPPKVI